MGAEPEWGEVVRWMHRHGGSAVEAARHFFPGVDPKTQDRLAQKYRKWWQIHRDKVAPDAPAPASAPRQASSAAFVPAAPTVDLTKLTPVERLEWQMQCQAAAQEQARAQGDLRAMTLVDQRITDIGGKLDEARALAQRVLKLDRTPGAVYRQLLADADRLALRAEMDRRKAERAAQAAEDEHDDEREAM